MRTTTPSSLSKPPPEPVHHQGRTPLPCPLLTHNGHPPSIHIAVAKRVSPLSVSAQKRVLRGCDSAIFLRGPAARPLLEFGDIRINRDGAPPPHRQLSTYDRHRQLNDRSRCMMTR